MLLPSVKPLVLDKGKPALKQGRKAQDQFSDGWAAEGMGMVPTGRGTEGPGLGVDGSPSMGKGTAMRSVFAKVKEFMSSEDGPTAVEYAVMLALIIVVCIGVVRSLGGNASATFSNVSTAIGSTS